MSSEVKIENVSDTALWVAVYRARETERPNALFRDALAARLVGERGRKIEAQMPNTEMAEWSLVIRTVAIDRLVLAAIEEGVDTVLNLGAGLDTRPYRMALKADLRWIEVDFPHLIAMKNEKLRDEKPLCKLTRISLDLSNSKLRRELFEKINAESKRVLVMTEGVIPYLSNEDAGALADDLLAQVNFMNWIQDFFDAHLSRQKAWRKKLKAAPFLFKAPDWLLFFAKRGWEVQDKIMTFEEGRRIGRPTPRVSLYRKLGWMIWFTLNPAARQRAQRSSGYVRLKRATRA